MEELKSFYKRYYRPDGTILSVAGAFDWNELQDEVEALFGSWKSQGSLTIQSAAPTRQSRHIDYDAQQTQIVVAYDGVPYSHSDFYRQMVGTSVLGGEASGRLFTQLRERQGLCYSVSAYTFMYPPCAAIFCSLGTSSENAEVALDGLLSEIQKLAAEGVTQEDLNRVKTRERTSLIMEQESCGARAVSIASDWINLRTIRTLDEHLAKIDALTVEDVNRYLAENSPKDFQITMVGGEEIRN
jgi:predicted Zn-dependent peptidase